uniref:ATP synthase complex subunit 8 n=1 Tax=Neomysis awatschensis TaxID=1049545 RepID=A0A6M3TWP2_9CRUS|nr:ATP synthase F0 subunit 8 [Neomysis awatschensis]
MPQMNPSLWLNIYLASFMVLVVMMIYTFYTFNTKVSVNLVKFNKPQLPLWLW